MSNSLVLDELIRKQVLPRYPLGADVAIARLSGGLINETFLVVAAHDIRFVLQRVNPLFSPDIHQNIVAVTAALQRGGLVTPLLVLTRDGRTHVNLSPSPDGTSPETVWRLMTYVEGTSFEVLSGAPQAHQAGALVARFHGALENLPHAFVGLRTNVHDTPRHLASLKANLRSFPEHRLTAQVGPLAEAILTAMAGLPPLPSLAPRVCHGDLKLNNFLFAGSAPPLSDQAVCLIDLDTVGPMALALEMGDAWRSWCNRNGEDQDEAALDLTLFEASLDGYRSGLGRSLSVDERHALLLGPEWVSLELSARFAGDALAESYFGWDPGRFAGRGEHDLVRARGQFSLAQALLNTRSRRAAILGLGT